MVVSIATLGEAEAPIIVSTDDQALFVWSIVGTIMDRKYRTENVQRFIQNNWLYVRERFPYLPRSASIVPFYSELRVNSNPIGSWH